MNNEINKWRRLQASMWATGLLVLGFFVCQPTQAQTQTPVTTPVPPSGTIGRIPKWTAGTVLGDSVITESSNNVGIGTLTPNAQLHITQQLRIDGTDVGGYRAIGFGGNTTGTNPTIYSNGSYLVVNGTNGSRLYLNWDNPSGSTNIQGQGGNVGIGTISPEARVHLYNSGTTQDNPFITIGPSVTNGMNFGLGGASFGDKSYFLHARDVAGSAATFRILTNGATRMFFAAAGNIGIGTTAPAKALDVVGDIYASGTISGGNVIAKYQDVAEWVPARNALPAGTVVTLDPEHSNLVVASSRSYDTRVAGVVSEKPGVILGEGGEGKVMVATTGRVRVKVDATNAPIRVGDLLVTSDKEGIAMRSQPLDLGGTPIHRPGTLIGKALEPLEKGVGKILVLLSLQ